MRDEDDAATLGHLVQRGEKGALGFRVQAGTRFVQDQDGGRGEQGPRQHQPPSLTAGEACAAFTDPGVEPIRQRAHHFANSRRVQRRPQRGIIRVGTGQAEIGSDRVVEQVGRLR